METKRRSGVLKNVYSIAAAIALLIPVPVAIVSYLMDSAYAAYVVSNYPVYKYVLSSVAAPETVTTVLAASGAVLILSSFVLEARFVLYALGTTFLLYTLSVLSLIVENEFFACDCGLFYQTENASMNLAVGVLLVAVNVSLIGPMRSTKSVTLFGIITDAIRRGCRSIMQ